MKKMKLTMLFGIVLLVFSCSTEETNKEEINETIEGKYSIELNSSTDNSSTQDRPNPLTNPDGYTNILIEWEIGVSEAQRVNVRKEHSILGYKTCPSDSTGRTEDWYLPKCYPNCRPEIPDPGDKDDIRTAETNASCN